MTASLAYLCGGGNSLVWSWFFWVYVHPLASIVWFTFSLFALLVGVEVHQLQKSNQPNLAPNTSYRAIEHLPEVIDVIVIPPPQLSHNNYASNMNNARTKQLQRSKSPLGLAQLPSSFD